MELCRWHSAYKEAGILSFDLSRRVGTEEGGPPAASCTSLHSEQGLPRSVAALRIPADFNSNYTTINQRSQDFGGHKKRVREDVCLCGS